MTEYKKYCKRMLRQYGKNLEKGSSYGRAEYDKFKGGSKE